MRIAIVAPLFEHVPPRKYGGTERIVYFMVEELVRLGHQVTLYATRGSQTSAELVECASSSFRELGIGDSITETRGPYTAQLQSAFSGNNDHDHDIVHIHHPLLDFHPTVLAAMRAVPTVWTDHNAVHNGNTPTTLNRMAKLGIGLTALSDSHRGTVPNADWLATIHHGLPVDMLTPSIVTPTYLGFLGRVSPEKGITTAVRISEAAGHQMKVAAKVDKVDLAFYEDEVRPLFDRSNVDFIGEITEKEKGPFLSGAIALIFPICWQEPFGLVMIEAMACGCPVIAFRQGSVPEIIEDGVTGFVVDTERQAIEALQHIHELDRRLIRQRFEERFTATAMAQKYVSVYERVIQNAEIMHEAKEAAKDIILQDIKQRDFAPGTVHAFRGRAANIHAAFQRTTSFQDVLCPSFLPRPALS